MDDAIGKLRSFISTAYLLPEKDMTDFTAVWKPFSARRKEIITATGDTEGNLYFVLEGVQRVYYFDEQGREATVVFIYPPSFGGVLDSFMLQKPSGYNYEALTPSNFLKTTFSEINELMESKPAIQKMMVKGLSEIISGMMERMVELQCFSSEDRFRKLLLRSPHILQLVPHKYLANYLGMDPTNFSKFINRIKI